MSAFNHWYNVGPPFDSVNRWCLINYNFTFGFIVLISIVRWGYKPTYNQGGPHCRYNEHVVQRESPTSLDAVGTFGCDCPNLCWFKFPFGYVAVGQESKAMIENFSGMNIHKSQLPSGKRLHNYGKSPFSMGKSTINGHVQ